MAVGIKQKVTFLNFQMDDYNNIFVLKEYKNDDINKLKVKETSV